MKLKGVWICMEISYREVVLRWKVSVCEMFKWVILQRYRRGVIWGHFPMRTNKSSHYGLLKRLVSLTYDLSNLHLMKWGMCHQMMCTFLWIKSSLSRRMFESNHQRLQKLKENTVSFTATEEELIKRVCWKLQAYGDQHAKRFNKLNVKCILNW